VGEERLRILNLVVGVHDEDGVQRKVPQPWVDRRSKDRPDVVQAFARRAPFDRVDHLPLDVLGIDDSVRADLAREPYRNPSASGAQVGDRAAVADAERVHDLIWPLPGVTVWPFELTEILRTKQPGALLSV